MLLDLYNAMKNRESEKFAQEYGNLKLTNTLSTFIKNDLCPGISKQAVMNCLNEVVPRGYVLEKINGEEFFASADPVNISTIVDDIVEKIKRAEDCSITLPLYAEIFLEDSMKAKVLLFNTSMGNLIKKMYKSAKIYILTANKGEEQVSITIPELRYNYD